jgi:hypothetical protein
LGYRQTDAEDHPPGGENLGGDARPDAVAGLDEHARGDEPFDDASRGFRGDLQRVAQSVDCDEWCASVHDLFEYRSDDLGSPGRIATIGFHRISLGKRCWERRLRNGGPDLISILNDSVKKVWQAQGEQIYGFVHHLSAPSWHSLPQDLSVLRAMAIEVTVYFLLRLIVAHTWWRQALATVYTLHVSPHLPGT